MTTRRFLVALAALFTPYVLWVFITLEPNPLTWSNNERGFYVAYLILVVKKVYDYLIKPGKYEKGKQRAAEINKPDSPVERTTKDLKRLEKQLGRMTSGGGDYVTHNGQLKTQDYANRTLRHDYDYFTAEELNSIVNQCLQDTKQSDEPDGFFTLTDLHHGLFMEYGILVNPSDLALAIPRNKSGLKRQRKLIGQEFLWGYPLKVRKGLSAVEKTSRELVVDEDRVDKAGLHLIDLFELATKDNVAPVFKDADELPFLTISNITTSVNNIMSTDYTTHEIAAAANKVWPFQMVIQRPPYGKKGIEGYNIQLKAKV